jgi:hypothetical protein
MNTLTFTLVTGFGATALLDLWGLARKPLLGMPRPDYAPVGRWFAHMFHGRFRHQSIAAASVAHGEGAIGWGMHYVTGLLFAALLVAIGGAQWMEQPSVGLALGFGVATVAAPFLLMQPCMGAGIAASRTPKPGAARMQALITHAVFGLGLYLAALLARALSS